MRPYTSLVSVLILASPLLLGMGALGGGQDVIQPPVDLSASLVDRGGTAVELSRVSIGGRVQLEGEMGRGRLRIPFENIDRISFAPAGGDWTEAKVQLKEGETVEVKVRSSLTFIGRTQVGLYEIRARDIEHIEFR